MVAALDRELGRVLAVLDREGLAERTLVVFLSDNGALVEGGGRNAPLRVEKFTTLEGGDPRSRRDTLAGPASGRRGQRAADARFRSLADPDGRSGARARRLGGSSKLVTLEPMEAPGLRGAHRYSEAPPGWKPPADLNPLAAPGAR